MIKSENSHVIEIKDGNEVVLKRIQVRKTNRYNKKYMLYKAMKAMTRRLEIEIYGKAL